jgi:hypothetical protein
MKSLRLLKRLLFICAASVAAFAAFGSASATAATVAGTWSCCGSESGASPQTWKITESGGSLSGTAASAESGQTFSPISGKISGTSVEIVTGPYYGSSYSATFIGTISGETMSGTWTSNASQKGTWTATRGSGGEEAQKKAEEEKKKEEEEKAKALRKAAIQLNCDSFYPGLPTEYFQCTAQVADASGKPPEQVPTGTVSFAVNSGGGGAILGTKTCTLAPSQTGGASSFCSIDYVPPASGIEIGAQPPITASYSGSSAFAKASTGPSDQLVQPLSPKEVFESLCVATFLPSCEGVVPPPQVLKEACFSLAPTQGDGSAAENICATLTSLTEDATITPEQSSITTDATCPAASSDGISSCELQAYVNGKDVDADVKAQLEYEKNYATYLSQVAAARAAFIQQTRAFIADLPVEGTPQERKEGEERHAQLSVKLSESLNEVFDVLSKRGTDNSGPYEPLDQEKVDKFCAGTVNKEDCHTFWQAIGENLKSEVSDIAALKARLGVNVKFKAPSSAHGASTASAHHPVKRRAHELVYASGGGSVAAGHTGRIRLAIPAFVRTRLKVIFAKHERTLKVDLVVHIMTATGATTTRTIPMKIRLVAKKPRRAAKKK